ncbi:MAG: response regulator transcription factor [Acidobacteriota bacterium]
MHTVMVVDDDPDILDLVSFNLSRAGFGCVSAADGIQAWDTLQRRTPDLVVLDLMLPGVSGLDLLRRLKVHESFQRIPVVVLSARGEEVDRVLGLELGADDYVTKPFSVRELVLRVQRVLSRLNADEDSPVMRCGGISLDPHRYEVKVQDQVVRLTTTEFNLLHCLLRNQGRVVTRDLLLEQVWGYRYGGTTRTVDTHVQRLREKLGPEASRLETVRGVGYRLEKAAGGSRV